MKKVINKTVKLDLIGVNSNAFAIMGAFREQAIQEGWTPKEIALVLEEAQSGNYDHLLATISNHCEIQDEKESHKKRVYAIYTSDVKEEDKYMVTTQPTKFFDTKEEAQEELERFCKETNQEVSGFVIYPLWKKNN